MRKIFLLLSIFVLFAMPSVACDFKKLFFGTSASHVIDQYDLTSLEMDISEMPKTGEFVIREFGNVACKNLPEGSFIEFTFIDDTLVKVKIENEGSSQQLLAKLQGTFGESDDKDRKKGSDGLTKIAMWDVDTKMSVLYSLGSDSNGESFESADISSKMHHSLFQKVVELKNKEIDTYLKENNLGKYSSSFQGSSSFKGKSGAINGKYDPDSLEKLKDGYDKSNDAWKERNENNPRQGR